MPRPAPLGPRDLPKAGRWRLLARLGSGGQAQVYLGIDQTGTEAAVKVLHINWDNSGTLKSDLERELLAVRRLAPFLTAKVLDFDLTGPVPYIASEYIEGPTLAEWVQENGVLKGGSLHHIAMQTMTALEAIHGAGLIHCDFKPANIILGSHGTHGARIIDFGIARTLDSTHRLGEVAGTVPFMAPEQIVGDHLSAKVDLFAWGSTITFAGTGKRAFPGHDAATVKRRILRETPQLYDLDESLRGVIRLCLRKRPEDRPTSADARRMLLGLPAVPPAEARKPAPPPQNRTARFAPGVARPGPVPRQPGPARTRVDDPGVRGGHGARPPAAAPAPAPEPDGVPRRGGHRFGAWWAAVAGAIAVAGVITATQVGWGDAGEPVGAPATGGAAVSSSPVNTLQRYLADWPGLSCGRDGLASGSAQRERRSCSLRWEGTDTILFCSRYADRDSMNHKGRPRSGVNSVKEVEWERGWTRNDGTRHGDFVSYTLVDAASGETKSAIWWQDDIQPVACMIHGPAGADDVLLDAFQRHDYTLTGPVRSAG